MSPAKSQDPVEWLKGCEVQNFFGTLWITLERGIALAERCREAEHQAISMTQKANAFERVGHELNEQLTAARAQITELETKVARLSEPNHPKGDWQV